MPSIDLPRVRAQAQRIAQLISDPEGFVSDLQAVLEEYAERAFRPGRMVLGETKWRSRGTPEQVMRALSSAIRPEARANVEAALRLLPPLWATGYREERILAAEMWGVVAPLALYPSLDLISAWAVELDSPETADALGVGGMGLLLKAEPRPHLHLLRRWLAQESRYTRRFAVMALLPLAQDKTHQGVQDLLEILADAMSAVDMEVRKAVVEVLLAVAGKSPVEAARFLREWAAKGDRNSAWIVRRAMVKLDAEEQAAIRSMMRAG